MRRRRRRALAVTGVAAVLSVLLAACGDGRGAVGPSSVGGSTVGVILPDAAGSARWESADRTFLADAFSAAGVDYDIQNAYGDPARFQALADAMIAAGVKVLIMVDLDPTTGAAVITKAARHGIPVVDYDRLTPGGGAAYYVSFDEVAVGRAVGDGLVRALRASGKQTGRVVELDGPTTDDAATSLREGYDQVIRAAGYTVVDSQPIPGWDAARAVTVFQGMLDRAGGRVDGVAAASDGLGGAALSVLERRGPDHGVPVTAQDATDDALRRVLLGTQYLTVYKPIKTEAAAAVALAIALARGDTDAAAAMVTGTVRDPLTGARVKAVLLPPKPVDRESVKDVVADGFTTAGRICTTPQVRQACALFGVSP